MEFNIDSLKARIQANGGIECLVAMIFNNSGIYYVWGDTDRFDPETDLLAEGETEIIRFPHDFYVGTNNNGMKILNIPKVVEKPVFTVESLMFVEKPEDMEKLDKADVRMY